MPELPEVQTTVDYLSKKLVGLRLVNLWSDREKPLRQAGGITKFREEIRGRKILSVKRRAKFIVIDIEGPKTIFIHQKISGHLMYGRWAKKTQINHKTQNTNKPQNTKHKFKTKVDCH